MQKKRSTRNRLVWFPFLMILWNATVLRAQEPRTPEAILERIDKLIGAEAAALCKKQKITYPPEAVLFRVFKKDKEFEIWAKNDGMNHMRKVQTLPICAADFDPGPKLRQGDGKTPEGFYHPVFLYGSERYWMWMKLTDKELHVKGEVGQGSSFKMCIEYPNRLDRSRSGALGYSGREVGGEICLHGNCVTAGCISFENKDFLHVFAFARHHDRKRYGKLQLHIFPFRYDGIEDMSAEADHCHTVHVLGKDRLLYFWNNLKKGYDLFNKRKNPLGIKEEITVLRTGQHAPFVIKLKQTLNRNGFYSGPMNDLYTSGLADAVRRYQRDHNLPADGIAGPKTLGHLGLPRGQYTFQ